MTRVFVEPLAVAEGSKEDKANWTAFLRHLKEGLKVSACLFRTVFGAGGEPGRVLSGSPWQRCTVNFYRNVWTTVPTSKVKEVAAMLKAIHAQEDRAAARQKAELVAGIEETLYYYAFPRDKSALMLAAARLRHVAGTRWGTRRFMDMNRLPEASEAACVSPTA